MSLTTDLKEAAKPAAEETQTVFIFSPTMLSSLSNRSGVNPESRIKVVSFKDENGKEHYFSYTHSAVIPADATDSEAAVKAFGNSARYWADCSFKLFRIPTEQIVEMHVDIKDRNHKTPFIFEGLKHYNYSGNNILALPKEYISEIPSFNTSSDKNTICQAALPS